MTGDVVEEQKKEIVLRDYLGYEVHFKSLAEALSFLEKQLESWLLFSGENFDVIKKYYFAGNHGHPFDHGDVKSATEGFKMAAYFGPPKKELHDLMRSVWDLKKHIAVNEGAPNRIKSEKDFLGLLNEVYGLILDYDQYYAKEYRRIYEQHGVKAARLFVSLLAKESEKAGQEFGGSTIEVMASLLVDRYLAETHQLLEEVKAIANLHRKNIITTTDEAELLGKDQLERQKTAFDELHADQSKYLKDKIDSLEEAFSEQLKLKKPVERWKEAAAEYKKSASDYAMYLVGALLMGMLFYFVMILKFPEQEHGLLSLQSLRSVTLVFLFSAAYFYGLRVLARLVFSSLHLARDAQEREYLTHVYLALIAEGGVVDESSRELVLQALFSRSNTGLLGDDSSPTMPSVGDVSRAVSAVSRMKS